MQVIFKNENEKSNSREANSMVLWTNSLGLEIRTTLVLEKHKKTW